jgi:hypothetical protein
VECVVSAEGLGFDEKTLFIKHETLQISSYATAVLDRRILYGFRQAGFRRSFLSQEARWINQIEKPVGQ